MAGPLRVELSFERTKLMKLFTLAALCGAGISTAFAAPGAIHLVQKPAMNKTEIVFSYSGDLWRVSREGGAATGLTSGPGFESDAAFSPDGKTLAFTGATAMWTSSRCPQAAAFPSV